MSGPCNGGCTGPTLIDAFWVVPNLQAAAGLERRTLSPSSCTTVSPRVSGAPFASLVLPGRQAARTESGDTGSSFRSLCRSFASWLSQGSWPAKPPCASLVLPSGLGRPPLDPYSPIDQSRAIEQSSGGPDVGSARKEDSAVSPGGCSVGPAREYHNQSFGGILSMRGLDSKPAASRSLIMDSRVGADAAGGAWGWASSAPPWCGCSGPTLSSWT